MSNKAPPPLWSEKLAEEMRVTIQLLKSPKPSPPLTAPSNWKERVEELKQVVAEMRKPAIPKPATPTPTLVWAKGLAEDLSSLLVIEEKKREVEAEKRLKEIIFFSAEVEPETPSPPEWAVELSEELRLALAPCEQKVLVSKEPRPILGEWAKDLFWEVWDEIQTPIEVFLPKKRPAQTPVWVKELKARLERATHALKTKPEVLSASPPSKKISPWVKKLVEETCRTINWFRRSLKPIQLPPPPTTGYFDLPGWARELANKLRREIVKLNKPAPKGRWAKKIDPNSTTPPWAVSLAEELRLLVSKPKAVKNAPVEEINWERKRLFEQPFSRQNPFPPANKKRKEDIVVLALTLDKERRKEAKLRLSHPDPTQSFKAREARQEDWAGKMKVIEVVDRKVDFKKSVTDARGNVHPVRVVYFELIAQVNSTILLKKDRRAEWRRFDPTVGRPITVAVEKGKGYAGWLTQQEETITKIDPAHSKRFGSKQLPTFPSGDAERCIPVLTSDGRREYISFGEYVSLEGEMMTGVCSELRRKFEI